MLCQVNTFQVVLACDGDATYVLFLYGDIQWSRNNIAIGFNGGDGVNFFNLPSAFTASGFSGLSNTSNVGIPGTFIFRVDQMVEPGMLIQ